MTSSLLDALIGKRQFPFLGPRPSDLGQSKPEPRTGNSDRIQRIIIDLLNDGHPAFPQLTEQLKYQKGYIQASTLYAPLKHIGEPLSLDEIHKRLEALGWYATGFMSEDGDRLLGYKLDEQPEPRSANPDPEQPTQTENSEPEHSPDGYIRDLIFDLVNYGHPAFPELTEKLKRRAGSIVVYDLYEPLAHMGEHLSAADVHKHLEALGWQAGYNGLFHEYILDKQPEPVFAGWDDRSKNDLQSLAMTLEAMGHDSLASAPPHVRMAYDQAMKALDAYRSANPDPDPRTSDSNGVVEGLCKHLEKLSMQIHDLCVQAPVGEIPSEDAIRELVMGYATPGPRTEKQEPQYRISACYFPGDGEIDITYEQLFGQQEQCSLTLPVTPEQGDALVEVIGPCVHYEAVKADHEPRSSTRESWTEDRDLVNADFKALESRVADQILYQALADHLGGLAEHAAQAVLRGDPFPDNSMDEFDQTEARANPPSEYWSEDPAAPVEDWQDDVGQDATRLGYWDWVEEQKDTTVTAPQAQPVPAEWQEAVWEFIERCESGHIRSDYTYRKFLDLVEGVETFRKQDEHRALLNEAYAYVVDHCEVPPHDAGVGEALATLERFIENKTLGATNAAH